MKKHYVGIDLLKVTYRASSSLIEELMKTNFLMLESFEINVIEERKSKREKLFSIMIHDYDNKEHYKEVFGTLRIGSTFEDDDDEVRYVFIKIDNSYLYRCKNKFVYYLEHIASSFGLVFNNISELEIAVDSHEDFARLTKRALRNKNVTTLLHGKVVRDREKCIKEIIYCYTGGLDKFKYLTMYIKQKCKKGFSLKMYDKFQEVEESKKYYIYDCYGIEYDKPLYRAEVTLRNKQIQEYVNKNLFRFANTSTANNKIPAYNKDSKYYISELLHYITDEKNLMYLWLIHVERLVRFRDKKGNKLSLIDVVFNPLSKEGYQK